MVAGLLGWDGTKKFPPLTLLPASFLERQVDSAGVLHFTENDQRVRWVERATPSNWPLEVSPHTQLLGFLWSFLQAKSCGFLGYVFFWDSYIGDGLESLTPNITFTWCFRILDLIPLFFLCQVRCIFKPNKTTSQSRHVLPHAPDHKKTSSEVESFDFNSNETWDFSGILDEQNQLIRFDWFFLCCATGRCRKQAESSKNPGRHSPISVITYSMWCRKRWQVIIPSIFIWVSPPAIQKIQTLFIFSGWGRVYPTCLPEKVNIWAMRKN